VVLHACLVPAWERVLQAQRGYALPAAGLVADAAPALVPAASFRVPAEAVVERY